MRKEILTTLRALRRLQRRREKTLKGLLVDEPLLKAGLSLVHRTCGKANCHCATGTGHPVWVLSSGPTSNRRTQVVRKADVEDVQHRVQLYREFKGALRELEAMAKEEKALLKGLIDQRDEPYE